VIPQNPYKYSFTKVKDFSMPSATTSLASLMPAFPASVSTLLAHLDAVRVVLLDELTHAHASQHVPPPAPERTGWSADEVAYHLHLVETGITRGLTKRLERLRGGEENAAASSPASPPASAPASAPASPPTPPPTPAELEALWHRQQAAFANRDRKISAPETTHPLNAPPRTEILRLLAESRAAFRALVASATYDELNAVAMPHPAFGAMSGVLWVNMIAGHEFRHIEQIRALRASA
jgi:hypothetical protein